MTDATVLSAADKALTEQTTFTKTAIWLPSYAVPHFNAGIHVIRGKVFEDCVIEGPALLLALEGVTFEGCNMGFSKVPKNLLMRPVGDKITGAIPFAETRFISCRFAMVSFTGNEYFLDHFGANVVAPGETEGLADNV